VHFNNSPLRIGPELGEGLNASVARPEGPNTH
jgi:hypothetical protein